MKAFTNHEIAIARLRLSLERIEELLVHHERNNLPDERVPELRAAMEGLRGAMWPAPGQWDAVTALRALNVGALAGALFLWTCRPGAAEDEMPSG